jgi:hypothetical protein
MFSKFLRRYISALSRKGLKDASSFQLPFSEQHAARKLRIESLHLVVALHVRLPREEQLLMKHQHLDYRPAVS